MIINRIFLRPSNTRGVQSKAYGSLGVLRCIGCCTPEDSVLSSFFSSSSILKFKRFHTIFGPGYLFYVLPVF
uniref:Uncharacterized protein n=1 Tax=Anopheles minimus TaxID=112268 RepID=A0A182WP33_9DIPT